MCAAGGQLSAPRPNGAPGWAHVRTNSLERPDLEGLAPPAWREDAACRDFPTDLFFPIGHGPRAQAQASQAKAICAQCPVRADCLEYSIVTNAQFGVFGGLTEDERRRLRRLLGAQVRFGTLPLEGQVREGPASLEASA